MCIPVPNRDELLLLSTSNTSCYLTRVTGITDNSTTSVKAQGTLDLGSWFIPQCPTQYSFFREKLYVGFASGKEIIEIDTREVATDGRVKVIRNKVDFSLKGGGGRDVKKKCDIF